MKYHFIFFLISLLFLSGCSQELPINTSDHQVLLKAADLKPYGYQIKDPHLYENIAKSKELFDQYQITYEFEAPESAAPLYIFADVVIDSDASASKLTQTIEKEAFLLLVSFEDIKEVEIKGKHSFGDESHLAKLVAKNKPVGNIYSMRKNNLVYTIVIIGFYFNEISTWEKLMQPKFEALANYKIQ